MFFNEKWSENRSFHWCFSLGKSSISVQQRFNIRQVRKVVTFQHNARQVRKVITFQHDTQLLSSTTFAQFVFLPHFIKIEYVTGL